MGEDVLKNVKKLLEQSGYPLEMQVAREFQRHGFAVEQARIYIDANTDVLRETDVLAYSSRLTTLYPGTGWAELRLVIECKHSDKPWLLFAGDTRFRTSREHFDALDIIEYSGGQLQEARSADDMPVISYVGDTAYRVATAGTRDDVAFNAVQQVNAAVLGVMRDLVTPEQHQGHPGVVALVPVVVTDSPLIDCRLDAMGEIVPSVIDKGLLLTRLRPEDRLHAVWIVSAAELSSFVDLAKTTVSNMMIVKAT